MSISDGLPAAEGDAAGVLAVGPDGQGGLLAAVSEVGKEIDKVTSPGYVSAPEGTQVRGGHFLYRYNGTSWSQVEDSCFSDYQKNSSGPDYSIPRLYNEALVILSDGTVWQYRGHWDGMQWIENDVEFNSFYRVSDTEIARRLGRGPVPIQWYSLEQGRNRRHLRLARGGQRQRRRRTAPHGREK